MTELRKVIVEDGELLAKDWLIEVQKGNVPGHSIVTKFGYASVSTALAPITTDLIYQAPSAAVTLEFISLSANDAAGGTGATKIIYEGLDANWDRVENEIATNGLTAVTLPDSLTRLDRWYVSESGTYADLANPSYAGNLSVQVAGGGALWSTIPAAAPFPAQSEIGVYALPRNKRAYLISKHLFTDTGKVANLYMLHRQHADDVTAPYSGVRRMLEREIGLSGSASVVFEALKAAIMGPADIGFVGNVSVGTADISVEFDLLVIDDGY